MLNGPRITLRAMSRDDLPRICAFNNDLEVELAGGGDPPMPQSLEKLQADFDREASSGGRNDGAFVIEVAGVLIGQAALFQYDNTAHTCELGITIGDRNYWSQGYGREAVALLVDYAFRMRNMHKVWLKVHGVNLRAQRTYASCGFVEEGRQRQQVWSNGSYDDLVYMGLLRSAWEQRAQVAHNEKTHNEKIQPA